MERTFNEFRAEVAQRCKGHWEEWFSLYLSGDDVSTLFRRRHVECPACGQVKFYLANVQNGTGHCCRAGCGHHTFDGLMTISALRGIPLGEVVTGIADHLGMTNKQPEKVFVPQKPKAVKRNHMTPEELQTLKRVCETSKPMEKEDVVWRYLVGRGLPVSLVSAVAVEGLILTNEELYHAPSKQRYPAMVVKVLSPSGQIAGAHRTFLVEDQNGNVSKLDHDNNKMLTASFPDAYIASRIELGGPAIPDRAIGIAEGIETALAVNAMGCHCWSTLNSAGIQSFIPPAGVKTICIFTDNDISNGGQIAAFKAKERLEQDGYEVKCYLPRVKGKENESVDWLDYFLQFRQPYSNAC
mgnify:CR=1 FL=1